MSTAETILPNLPEEMWGKLLTYLSIQDRKNLRLSCRHFYEACNTSLIQRSEKFLFCGNINTEAALLSFSQSERNLWNIEMYRVHLMEDSILPFFEKQGSNVRSLTLESCVIGPGILKKLLESCTTLCSVEFLLKAFGNNAVFFNEFEALEKDGIVCPNVTNFSLLLTSSSLMTNCKFLRFFTIFPNIIKLDIQVPIAKDFGQFSTISSDVNSAEVFSFSSVYYQIFKMRYQLEKLKLNFGHSSDYPLSIRILNNISSIEMKNLKELSLNCGIDLWDTSLMDSVLQLKYLTEFDYTFTREVSQLISCSDLIQYILNTATELRSLTMRRPSFSSEFYINKDCFQALMRSQLITLKVMFLLKVSFEYSSLNSYLSLNRTLKYLIFGNFDNSVVMLFAEYFTCLERLDFKEVTRRTLSIIFKQQMKLHKLSLYNCDKYSCYADSHICIDKLSLQQWSWNEGQYRRLEYLTHLQITETETLDLSEFLINKRTLPKLKSLLVFTKNSYTRNSISNFNLLCQNIQELTELEYLKIMWEWEGIIHFNQWLALCSTLPKLRYLLMETRSPFKKSSQCGLFCDWQYRKLFEVRPSLRTIVHQEFRQDRPWYTRYFKYFKDIVTNTVISPPPSSSEAIYEDIPQEYQ